MKFCCCIARNSEDIFKQHSQTQKAALLSPPGEMRCTITCKFLNRQSRVDNFTPDCSMYKFKPFSNAQMFFGTSECCYIYEDFWPLKNLVGLLRAVSKNLFGPPQNLYYLQELYKYLYYIWICPFGSSSNHQQLVVQKGYYQIIFTYSQFNFSRTHKFLWICFYCR